MDVSRIRALRGPNLWSRNTAIESIVTCSDAECAVDEHLPEFEARLRARFPQIGRLRPEGHHGALSIAHVLQAVALGLQAHAGCPVAFGRTAATVEPGVFQVVVEYSEEEVGRRAVELAADGELYAAEQQAKAKRMLADADAYATAAIATAIREGGLEAAQYQVAMRQVDVLAEVGKGQGRQTVIVPASAVEALGDAFRSAK